MIRIRTFLMNSIGMKFDPDPEDGAWSFTYGNSVSKTVTEYGQYVGFDTTTTVSGQTYYTLLGGGAYATSEGTINFKTTKANQQVQISLSPSSQANGDYVCAGKLDSDDIVNMQGKTSGTTATTVTYTVATPGDHYVKILFRNDASTTANNNRGHARLIPFSNTVTGLDPDVLVVNMKSFSAWQLVSKPDWITLSTAANGVLNTSTIVERGRLDLTVTAAINYGTARSGNIVLRETKKGVTFTIPVTQATCPNQVILSRDYLYKNDDPSESSQITVDINGANTSWTATCTSKGSWFSISPTSGGDNATVTISWNGNQSSGASARSSVVTFTGNQGGTDQLTIYQERYICHCNCQNYCQCDIEEACPTWYTNRCYCETEYIPTCTSKCRCNNNCNECSTECHTVCYCDSECHNECSTECHTVGNCNGTYTANKCLSGYGSCNGTYCSQNCYSGYGSCNGTYCSQTCRSGYDTCGCETQCESRCAGQCSSGYDTCDCETQCTTDCSGCYTGYTAACPSKCVTVGSCTCNETWCNTQCTTKCVSVGTNKVCNSGYNTCGCECVCDPDCSGCYTGYVAACTSKCVTVGTTATCGCQGICDCDLEYYYDGCHNNSYSGGAPVQGEDASEIMLGCSHFGCKSQCSCDIQCKSEGSCRSVSICVKEAYACIQYDYPCMCDTQTAACPAKCVQVGTSGSGCTCNNICTCDTTKCNSDCDENCGNVTAACGTKCVTVGSCTCNGNECDNDCDTKCVTVGVSASCTCNNICTCDTTNCKSDCDTHCTTYCTCNNDVWTCKEDCDTNCTTQCSCHNQCTTNCASQCSCHNQCSTHCTSQCSCHNQCTSNCTNICYCDSQCPECSSECHSVCYCDSDVCTCHQECVCHNQNCPNYNYCTTEKQCPTYCTTDHKCACDNYQAPV